MNEAIEVTVADGGPDDGPDEVNVAWKVTAIALTKALREIAQGRPGGFGRAMTARHALRIAKKALNDLADAVDEATELREAFA